MTVVVAQAAASAQKDLAESERQWLDEIRGLQTDNHQLTNQQREANSKTLCLASFCSSLLLCFWHNDRRCRCQWSVPQALLSTRSVPPLQP